MKKFLKYLLVLLMVVSCATLEKTQKSYEKYKLDAKIVTEKGDINVFLYPSSAPETVANFIFLADNDFYDGLTIHRSDYAVIQGGDPLGNGMGGTKYTINDEFDGFLQFNYEGVLAMANAGPNTSSSQFFITKEAMSTLNGDYAAFGTIKGLDDLIVVKSIEVGDKILDVVITGDKKDEFLSKFQDKINEWKEKIK